MLFFYSHLAQHSSQGGVMEIDYPLPARTACVYKLATLKRAYGCRGRGAAEHRRLQTGINGITRDRYHERRVKLIP